MQGLSFGVPEQFTAKFTCKFSCPTISGSLEDLSRSAATTPGNTLHLGSKYPVVEKTITKHHVENIKFSYI